MKAKVFSFFFLAIMSVPAWSWNFRVHAVIAQMAAESIPSKKLDEYNADARALMKRLDTVWLNEINTFEGVSDFAKTALLMDEWRMMKLATLFKKYDVALPEPLSPWGDTRVRELHFADIPWPDTGACANLATVARKKATDWIGALKRAADTPYDSVTNGIVRALLAHVVGDFHQPLHTILHGSMAATEIWMVVGCTFVSPQTKPPKGSVPSHFMNSGIVVAGRSNPILPNLEFLLM